MSLIQHIKPKWMYAVKIVGLLRLALGLSNRPRKLNDEYIRDEI